MLCLSKWTKCLAIPNSDRHHYNSLTYKTVAQDIQLGVVHGRKGAGV